MKIVYPAPGGGDAVQITLDYTEAIGLYKMAIALDTTEPLTQRALLADEDVGPLTAALLVQLSGIVGP